MRIQQSLCDIYISWKQNVLFSIVELQKHRGSYMSAHVLLNLLNKLGKRDKM